MDSPLFEPVFYHSYSRAEAGSRESWEKVADRSVSGLVKFGGLDAGEAATMQQLLLQRKVFASGRWLWVGGTEWVSQPENFAGAYNCSSTEVSDVSAFGLLMDLAMTGCGTGAVLEERCIGQLPPIRNRLTVKIAGEFGDRDPGNPDTLFLPSEDGDRLLIQVGDSRKGWASAYQGLIEAAMDDRLSEDLMVTVDISHVRPAGRRLKGFGGVANPSRLSGLFPRVAQILNRAIGRQLTAEECCLLIDEAAIVVVSGNIRRSAGIRQFDASSPLLKENLWQQDPATGDWKIDPDRDALRAANHTRVYHRKPTEEECIEAVRKQFYSGEGAIQYAPEAIARASADLLSTEYLRRHFLAIYADQGQAAAGEFLRSIPLYMDDVELDDRMHRYGLNPCLAGETIVLYHDHDWAVDHQGYCLSEPKESTIKELAKKSQRGEKIWVHDGRLDHRWVETEFRCTNPAAEIWEVVYRIDGEDHLIRTTGNHQFFLWDEQNPIAFTPVSVSDIQDGQKLRAIVSQWNVRDAFAEVVSVTKADAIEPVYCCTVPTTNSFDLLHLHSHNCGEIVMTNNFCNLSEVHLNQLDPFNPEEQRKAFHTAGLFAAPLLHHHFDEIDPRYAYSRQVDPIVGVSFTGLFDFFVKLIGVDWLRWWEAGRPEEWQAIDNPKLWALTNHFPEEPRGNIYKRIEARFLAYWRLVAEKSVWDYCDRNGLRRPNRCTTVQPAGSKSLLTGASPGWHPPIAARFIRRITFRKDDPIALACLDHGYTIVPSQSDKDEHGNLLNDPFDPRCTEWLVEIPVAVSWADLPGADTIAIENFSALAQFDFYMQVQTHYTTHNTSATISLREHEIEPLGRQIYQAIADDDGYISAALLARFDSLETFPRLPFEPIDRDTYDRLVTEVIARRKSGSFHANLLRHDAANPIEEDASQRGPAQCDSGKCWIG